MAKISLRKIMGDGYNRGFFTNCHCRYRAFKGARNTKKSFDIGGIEPIVKIISNPLRNVVFVRSTQSSQKYSTFATLQVIINQLGLDRYFKYNINELTITYKPTGQLILFKGFDDAQKLQSIRVPKGYLTDVYVEEAFEITDYEKWRKFDGSIRGKLPDGLFHQITFLFNAWNKDHWLYEKLFKGRLEDDVNYLSTHDYQDWEDENLTIGFGRGLYLHTSTYTINEFRDKETYDPAMEELRRVAPEIWKVEALGMWGNAGEATYPEFNDHLVKHPQELIDKRYRAYAIGIDTGLSNGEGKIKRGDNVRIHSATTMQLVGVTQDCSSLCCLDEYFYSNEQQLTKKTEPELMHEIIETLIKWMDKYVSNPIIMKGTVLVYVDCADIGFRQGLELLAKQYGLYNIIFQPSTKIRIQSRVDFIRLIMAYGEFQISSDCKNLIREIKNSRHGEKGEVREDFDDHAINANEYAWQPIIKYVKRWGSFKQH